MMSDTPSNHHWTEAEVLATLVPDEKYRNLEPYNNPIVNAAFNFLAQKEIDTPHSLLKQIPHILVMSDEIFKKYPVNAFATISQSGTPYVLVNPAFILRGNHTDQQLVSAMTHELGHFAKGHASLQGIMNAYNGVDHIAREKEANRYAVDHCQGEGLISILEQIQAGQRVEFERDAKNKSRNFDEWQRENDPSHPPISKSISLIKEEIRTATSQCREKPQGGFTR